MSWWHRLLRALGFRTPAERIYYLDDDLVKSLRYLAEQEQRSEEQVAADLISNGFSHRMARQEIIQRWWTLSPREQQVVAMVCQNYSTHEMAAQMVVSTNTIKAHIRHALAKFEVHSRDELRLLLADFDFGRSSQWTDP